MKSIICGLILGLVSISIFGCVRAFNLSHQAQDEETIPPKTQSLLTNKSSDSLDGDNSGGFVNWQTEMTIYMLANPQASAAVLASGGELAIFLEQNLDPKFKAGLSLLGANGTSYCHDRTKLKYCNYVAANLSDYVVKIENYNLLHTAFLNCFGTNNARLQVQKYEHIFTVDR